MRILIAGSTGGIGSAVKTAALELGHEVVEVNREDFGAPLSSLLSPLSSLDSLVYCVGTCPVKPLALTSDELFAETFRVNCTIFLGLLREIVAEKLYNPNGMRVIAVSSVSAVEGWPGGAAYCASKGALSAFCRAADAELKAKKISVKAIEPRYVKTKMFDNCAGRMGVPKSAAMDPKDLAKEILDELG